MARIKGGLNAKKRHNRVLKLAKGYYGARSKQYRIAKQSVMRALTSAYAGRKQRKRDFRKLWIARINAASRINGLSYSQFMHGLKLARTSSLNPNNHEGCLIMQRNVRRLSPIRSRRLVVLCDSPFSNMEPIWIYLITCRRKSRRQSLRWQAGCAPAHSMKWSASSISSAGDGSSTGRYWLIN